MRSWFCILILAAFALNSGLFAAGALTSPPTQISVADQIDNATASIDIAEATSRCCMDELASAQSGTTRCSSDCGYAITSVFIMTVPSMTGSRQRDSEAVWPRNTGTVFRPPIA